MAYLKKRGKRWCIRYYEGGERKQLSLKTENKQLATERLREFERELERRELGLEPVVKVKPILISQFIAVYQEERQRIGKSQETIGIDIFALKDLMKFTGDYRIDTINAVTALQYRNHLLENVKPTTASIRLRAIRTAFNWAVEKPGDKYLKVNQFKQKGLIPSTKEKPKYLALTPDEKRRFLNVIDDPNHMLLFKFFLLTGCRRSEVVNLQWSDIDLTKKVIDIRQTKTYRNRAMPINMELWQVVSGLDKSRQKPFNYTGGWISHLFKKYLRKANCRECIHLHCLRHTCATELINKGIPIQKVKDFLNHASIETTQIYLHSSGEDLRECSEVLTCLG